MDLHNSRIMIHISTKDGQHRNEMMFSSEMYIGNDPHLKQPGVVGEGVLPVPVGVIYLVPPAGQQQLV